MEPGKSLNLDGKAAYQPEHTYAHPIAQSFASAVGYDPTGSVVSTDTPAAGPSSGNVATPDFRTGAR